MCVVAMPLQNNRQHNSSTGDAESGPTLAGAMDSSTLLQLSSQSIDYVSGQPFGHQDKEPRQQSLVADEPVSSSSPHEHLEPTPITDQGVLQAVQAVDSLPWNMITCCDEFIEALSHISDSTSDDVNVVSMPLEQSLLVSSEPQGTVSVGSDEDPSMRIHPYQHERWMERYEDLVNYYQTNGHCNVPYVYKANPCLGQWVKRQRHQFKLRNQGQHSNLTEDRIQMLDMLGFIWDSHGAAWEEKFLELKQFCKSHGHCNVPCIYNGTSKLSTWLKRQRRQYRLFVGQKPSTMDYERISKLESLGFVWDYYGGKSCPPKCSR